MTDADLTRRARDEAERRWPAWRTLRPGELMRNSDAEWVQLGFIAGAEWAVSELPIPADDDAPCPRCGCPTACPEGRMEALSAELAEAKAEVERLRPDALAKAKADALREAARLARFLWTGTTNLPDLDDAEVGYSFDRWLEVYADRIEREGGEGE